MPKFIKKNLFLTFRLASIVQMRFVNVWISSDSIFKLTKAGKEHDHSIRVIQEFVDKVIIILN